MDGPSMNRRLQFWGKSGKSHLWSGLGLPFAYLEGGISGVIREERKMMIIVRSWRHWRRGVGVGSMGTK